MIYAGNCRAIPTVIIFIKSSFGEL